MTRKQIYFTADWHLFHDNILKFCESSIKDMDELCRVLVNNYNSCVPTYGTCYFLGDMGKSDPQKMQNIIKQLNGTKIILYGNHDAKLNGLYNYGFDVVLKKAVLDIANEEVTLSHCPLLDTFREDTTKMTCEFNEFWYGNNRKKHRNLSFENKGQFHLHGHIHSPNKGYSDKILGRQYDVGVWGNKFFPVSISQIESFIAKTKLSESV